MELNKSKILIISYLSLKINFPYIEKYLNSHAKDIQYFIMKIFIIYKTLYLKLDFSLL